MNVQSTHGAEGSSKQSGIDLDSLVCAQRNISLCILSDIEVGHHLYQCKWLQSVHKQGSGMCLTDFTVVDMFLIVSIDSGPQNGITEYLCKHYTNWSMSLGHTIDFLYHIDDHFTADTSKYEKLPIQCTWIDRLRPVIIWMDRHCFLLWSVKECSTAVSTVVILKASTDGNLWSSCPKCMVFGRKLYWSA